MFVSPTPRPADRVEPNLGDVLEDTLHQAQSLVQAELSLARHELSTELSRAYGALGLLLAAAILLQAGLATLGVLLVLAFGVGGAAVSVVLAFLVAGTVLLLVGLRSLGKRHFTRTAARLALDAKQVLETVK